jgi:hypothetical protein
MILEQGRRGEGIVWNGYTADSVSARSAETRLSFLLLLFLNIKVSLPEVK